MKKKTILVDFDGTLNSYTTKFDAENPDHLPDPPLPGAISFLRELIHDPTFEPVIFTTRMHQEDTRPDWMTHAVRLAIHDWLIKHGLTPEESHSIDITAEKRPCKLIIDDNAFRFEGKYPTPQQLKELTK